jgi:cyclic pyranopterin phosphate synthase
LRAARKGRNPATGQAITIKASKNVRFTSARSSRKPSTRPLSARLSSLSHRGPWISGRGLSRLWTVLCTSAADGRSPRFSHLDDQPRPHGGVSDKPVSRREAGALCRVRLTPAMLDALGRLPKATPAVARLAGIQAAGRTDEWIPLPTRCRSSGGDRVRARAEGLRIRRGGHGARTGAEMEALVACAAAALALYDMVKAIERGAVIEELRLEHKRGGRSGDWKRE